MPKGIGPFTADASKGAISSDELSLWMSDITAKEMLMIIDSCYSAAAVQGNDFKPGPTGSRGLGQLAYDKGMRILAATQDVALELRNLHQGLLSYTLLTEGIEGRKADTEAEFNQITAAEWLGFAVKAVPQFYVDTLAGKEVTIDGKTVISRQKGALESTDLQ
jgi:RNase P/RNase MRP subunit p29